MRMRQSDKKRLRSSMNWALECADDGCLETMVSLIIGLLYASLQLPLDNHENKNCNFILFLLMFSTRWICYFVPNCCISFEDMDICIAILNWLPIRYTKATYLHAQNNHGFFHDCTKDQLKFVTPQSITKFSKRKNNLYQSGAFRWNNQSEVLSWPCFILNCFNVGHLWGQHNFIFNIIRKLRVWIYAEQCVVSFFFFLLISRWFISSCFATPPRYIRELIRDIHNL